MIFEYDRAKSASNRIKHGIDFDQAQALWRDSRRVEIPALTVGEPRWLLIGMIEGRHWAAVYTHRDERIRLISVRRARKQEVAFYDGESDV